MRGVSVCLIFCMVILRSLYFAMDPLNQTGTIPYYLEQLIFGYGYYFGITSYLVVVLFWMDMSKGFIKHNGFLVKRTKHIFIALAISLFIVEFVRRTLYGVHVIYQVEYPIIGKIYNGYLAFWMSVVSGGTLLYGLIVYYRRKNISKMFPAISNDMEGILKVTQKLVIISVTFILAMIGTLIVTIIDPFTHPMGAIIAFTVDHLLELLLVGELLVLMSPSKFSLPVNRLSSPSGSTSSIDVKD